MKRSYEIDPNRAEHEANSNLIAAAPDLLAAAEDILAWADSVYFGNPDNRTEIRVLRAAIARARGVSA